MNMWIPKSNLFHKFGGHKYKMRYDFAFYILNATSRLVMFYIFIQNQSIFCTIILNKKISPIKSTFPKKNTRTVNQNNYVKKIKNRKSKKSKKIKKIKK